MIFRFSRINVLTLLVGILLISSCRENKILPPDLVPEIDNIFTFDTTLGTITHTVYQDSISTGGSADGLSKAGDPDFYHAIGTVRNNPVFGNSLGGSYIQFVPTSPAFEFIGSNRVLDSAVLELPFITSFGDSVGGTPLQNFYLYRATENYSLDSNYYEFHDIQYDPLVLGSASVDFNLLRKDSPQTVFIPLNSGIANELFNVSTNVTQDYATFLDSVKGFYIIPDSAIGNTLGYFNTYASRIRFYYRSEVNNVPDTFVSSFVFNADYCNRINRITRNYNGSQAANYFNTGNVAGDEYLFQQGEPGAATEIAFEGLENMPNCVINKAELILTAISPYNSWSDTSRFYLPNRLQVTQMIDSSGNISTLPDYFYLGANWVGGYRSYTDFTGTTYIQYKIRLDHLIQKSVTEGIRNYKLRINCLRTGRPGEAQVIFAGSGHADSFLKPKLYIIFTKL